MPMKRGVLQQHQAELCVDYFIVCVVVDRISYSCLIMQHVDGRLRNDCFIMCVLDKLHMTDWHCRAWVLGFAGTTFQCVPDTG